MAQLLYELCFCLWSVSLCDEAKQDFLSCGAVPILAQQVLHGSRPGARESPCLDVPNSSFSCVVCCVFVFCR